MRFGSTSERVSFPILFRLHVETSRHAYLHRKEGDQGNAAYWYSRAGKPVCREPLDAEWLGIVRDLLG